MVSRVNGAHPTLGMGHEFYGIAAVVIGGISIRPGEGHDFFPLVGSLAGALVITMLINILNLRGVSPFFQNSIMGVVLIIAALLTLLDARSNRIKSWLQHS